MRIENSLDEFAKDLKNLQIYDADPLRVERIRSRCLTALAARRRSNEYGSFLTAWRCWLEPAAALALSTPYLAAAVQSSFALLR